MRAFIRPAVLADAHELANTLCDADKTELLHLGEHPADALVDVVNHSAFTVEYKKQVVAIFGCIDCGTYGRPFMLSTNKTRHAVCLLREARGIVIDMAIKYGYLTNVCWLGNTRHLAWIDWLGFEYVGVEQINDEQFMRFQLACLT